VTPRFAESKQAVNPNVRGWVLRLSIETMTARIVRFISRTEQLRLRGNRNYSRYMQVTKRFVHPMGAERRLWQQESAEESKRDAEWNNRHGPIPGGAVVLSIFVEPLLRPIVSRWARERKASSEPTGVVAGGE
jgi:hypothetical protein